MHIGTARLAILVIGIGVALAAGAPAGAQEMTTAPRAVERCLCAQRAVSIMERALRDEQARDRRLHADADSLSRQVDEARPRVNVDVRSDIEAFKGLLARRDDAARAAQAEDQRLNDVVARYNNAVESNNAACSGRLFDPEEVEAVKARLVCPRL